MKRSNPEAFYRNFGHLVGNARRTRNLTQGQLADSVGLTRTSITNIEKGRQKILIHTLFDIAAVLNVEPATLFPAGASPSQLERLEPEKKELLLRVLPELVNSKEPV